MSKTINELPEVTSVASVDHLIFQVGAGGGGINNRITFDNLVKTIGVIYSPLFSAALRLNGFTDYETLVLNDDDIPNKKYVDDLISGENLWDRDAVNGYLYQHTLTDKVGFGTITPTEMIDVNGNINLPVSTSSVGVIKINGVRYFHAYGTNNLFVGSTAGNFTVTGEKNTVFGKSGTALTSGDSNTLVGYEAALGLTTGYSNVVIGVNALKNATSIRESVIVGMNAGANATTGNGQNVYVGYNAGNSHTTQVGLTYVGYNAGANATSGVGGTFVGTSAGDHVTTGSNNSFFGYQAGHAVTSTAGSTAIGYQALLVGTGAGNIAIGNGAGNNITTAANCLIIGNIPAASATISNQFNLWNCLLGKTDQSIALNVSTYTNYETLVLLDDDIPNKKYVDDLIGGENLWDRDAINGYIYPHTATDRIVGLAGLSINTTLLPAQAQVQIKGTASTPQVRLFASDDDAFSASFFVTTGGTGHLSATSTSGKFLFNNASVIGTISAANSSGSQLSLQYDGTKRADFTVDTNHDLTIQPTSTGSVILKPTTDSTDFVKIQSNDGTRYWIFDTTNGRIGYNKTPTVHYDGTVALAGEYSMTLTNTNNTAPGVTSMKCTNDVGSYIQLKSYSSANFSSNFATKQCLQASGNDMVIATLTTGKLVKFQIGGEAIKAVISPTGALFHRDQSGVGNLSTGSRTALEAVGTASGSLDQFRVTFGNGNPNHLKYVDINANTDSDLLITPVGNKIILGNGAAGVDYQFKIDGETNDGTLTFMEDENYWEFGQPISILNSTSDLLARYKSTYTSGYGAGVGIAHIVDDGAALAGGDRIAYWEFAGAKDGAGNLGYAAVIEVHAGGDWDSGSTPTYISFITCASGTTSRGERFRIDPSGNALLYNDNSKFYLGASQDMSSYYDGTDGYIKTNEVAASDLHVVCGTDKTLVLDESVWDDIRIQPGSFDRPGVSDPTMVAYTPSGSGTATYLWEFDKDDIASFTVQLPHNYKQGTDIKAHIHWTAGSRGTAESGNTVGWKIDYSWINIDGAFGAMGTADLSDACDGTDHKHQTTDSVTISGTGKNISSMLICNVKRTDTGTDDTWVSTTTGELPLLLEIDFHYEIDTIGSRQAGVK